MDINRRIDKFYERIWQIWRFFDNLFLYRKPTIMKRRILMKSKSIFVKIPSDNHITLSYDATVRIIFSFNF